MYLIKWTEISGILSSIDLYLHVSFLKEILFFKKQLWINVFAFDWGKNFL